MNRGTRTLIAALITHALACLLLVGVTPAGTAAQEARRATSLPGGGKTIFGKKRFLTAFYGTAGTSSLGVLGENSPDGAFKRIKNMGRPFLQRGEQLMPVYELIVSVADGEGNPGLGDDYSHDIEEWLVQSYIDAAHRNGALLLLDIQPGRSDFLTPAKRWEWALQDPWVGLALDPEWRVGTTEIPGRVFGSVSAKEINRTAGWLATLTKANNLPEKLFVLHQFRAGQIPDIGKVRARTGLAMVQHVDGYGSPANKLATYDNVAKPGEVHHGLQDLLGRGHASYAPARCAWAQGRAVRVVPVIRA
ncbi:hypothetical protein [Nocardioides sp. B-3]|uniref:hypothetical protein n=1 Tax=Nocardioides sp. B-3 TaxID=2895565 RepID=UPI00215342EC|nr:hypothetical protein [Nocardioides sp. B-3]UUZ58739.1 hypothetical protein LP418_21925 [Nocardioides sp. B-3]